jgi:RimJ/RimL family protein N-acetyltransferase
MNLRGLGGVPPGYPENCQRQVRLHDGRQVFIRPIVPADAAGLAQAITDADADTLRRRFLGGAPPVTPALLARLTQVDYRHRFALVAFDQVTGQGVAIARYELADPGTAEVAVVVNPAWRRVGLATELIAMLAQAALDRGIVTFTASYFAGNRPVAALVEDAGAADRQVIKQGIAEFSVALERGDSDASAHRGPDPAD